MIFLWQQTDWEKDMCSEKKKSLRAKEIKGRGRQAEQITLS